MDSIHLLKTTTSRCPVCRKAVSAEVVRVGSDPGEVHLRRRCAEHGEFSARLATDARFYWLAQGFREEGSGSCCGGSACAASNGAVAGTLGRNAQAAVPGSFDSLSTCLALIEVVDSCNLACPTCYADSPHLTSEVRAPSLENLQQRIEGVISRKGPIEILQLSGGEPTLHPRFFELLAWTMAHSEIQYVLLNTNGVRLAREPAFAAELGRTARRGKFQLYLQFDGPQAGGQRELRGGDLRTIRIQALDACVAHGLAVTLAMTVIPENLDQIGDALAFGLARPEVRGISFQPRFQNGRTPVKPGSVAPTDRLNAADIVLAAVAQSQGRLHFDDFTPLPCGDPNCAIIGYLLRIGGEVRSISEFVDFRAVQGFLQDKVRYTPADLAQCGCESEPLGALLKQFELDERHPFRIFIKPFMDDWTWDQDRIDRCCTHVIRPDGQLDSFCRYYAGFPPEPVALPKPRSWASRIPLIVRKESTP